MTTNVTIRMDEDLKRQTDEILAELGLSFTTAVNVFARQVVRQRAIPFEVTLGGATPAVEQAFVDAAMSFAEKYSDDFERLAQ